MDKYEAYEEIEEITRQICMLNDAGEICLPDKFIEWVTDKFINDYKEDPERFPDSYYVIGKMCDYITQKM